MVHRAGADLAGRRRPEHDPRRRRRRHAARPQGRRVREGRRRAGSLDRPTREEFRVILDAAAAHARRGPAEVDAASATGIKGVTEETTTGVHRLYEIAEDRRPAVPGDQRQRLGHQVEVRQPLRLPPLARRRHQPRDRRDDRRQGRRRLRLRRRRQGLRPSRCAARAPASSSPRSTRSARCRPRWRATRSPRSRTSSRPADIFITTTGNKDIITADRHGPDEAPGDRRQHRPLRQRDRHRRPRERPTASSASTSSRRSTSGSSPTATRSSCCPRAAC